MSSSSGKIACLSVPHCCKSHVTAHIYLLCMVHYLCMPCIDDKSVNIFMNLFHPDRMAVVLMVTQISHDI